MDSTSLPGGSWLCYNEEINNLGPIMQITTYHGTFWDQEEEFERPSVSYSDLDAIFVSDGQPVAERFTAYHGSLPEDGSVFVVMRGTTTLRNPFIYDPASTPSPWVEVSEDEEEYHIANDREEFFHALKRAGHGACIIKDNYPEGDDIALFDDEAFSAKGYSLSFDGKTWSEWMDFEEALEYFAKGKVTEKDLFDDINPEEDQEASP